MISSKQFGINKHLTRYLRKKLLLHIKNSSQLTVEVNSCLLKHSKDQYHLKNVHKGTYYMLIWY